MHLTAFDPAVLAVPALVSPVVLTMALWAQRKAGPGAAGLVAALPFQLAIGAVGVALTMDLRTAADFGLAAATYLPAQVAYATAFAAGMRRGGVPLALVAGTATYGAVVAIAQAVDPAMAIAAGVIALGLGRRWVQPRAGQAPSERQPPAALVIGVGTASVLVVVALAHAGGPTAGAFLGAIPAIGTTLAIALSRTRGREAGTETMAGTIRGLPSYFAFAIVLALLVERMGLVATCIIALVASGAAATASWHLGASARREPR